MNLKLVTLTGADDSIDPKELVKLSQTYPFVEWGILMTKQPIKASRFPSRKWINELVEVAEPNMNLCAHLCGAEVFDALIFNNFKFVESLSKKFKRVQLNTHGARLEGLAVSPTYINCLNIPRRIIFQCDGVNNHQVKEWVNLGFGVPLFDTSSGGGVLPEEGWPKVWEGVYCGYAGGLGPDNVVDELKKIETVTDDSPFWIDMETKVRSHKDKLFDLDKCRTVLEACEPYVQV